MSEILRRNGATHDPQKFFETWDSANRAIFKEKSISWKESAKQALQQAFGNVRGDPNDISILFDRLPDLPPYPDVKPVLTELKEKFRIGVITNADRDVFERLNIGVDFDVVVTWEDAGVHKPDPKIYLHAAKLFGCEVHEILHSCTSIVDVEGAMKVGMYVAWINRRNQRLPTIVPKPHFEFSDLAGLRKLFD